MDDLIFIIVFTGSASILLNLMKYFEFKNKYFVKTFDMGTQTDSEDEKDLEIDNEEEYIEPEILPVEQAKPKKRGWLWN